MSSTEWGVRWKTDDGTEHAPMPSEEVARNTASSMKQSYPWPEEIEVIRRKVCDWIAD